MVERLGSKGNILARRKEKERKEGAFGRGLARRSGKLRR